MKAIWADAEADRPRTVGPWSRAGTARGVIRPAGAAPRPVEVSWRPLSGSSAGGFAVVSELGGMRFLDTGRVLTGPRLLLRWTQLPHGSRGEALAREHDKRVAALATGDIQRGVLGPLLWGELEVDGLMYETVVVVRATGGSLADRLLVDGAGRATGDWADGLGFRAAAALLLPVAEALLQLQNDNSGVHRDIHPANVMLRRPLPEHVTAASAAEMGVLIDFDLLVQVGESGPLPSPRFYGADHFTPPEILGPWEEPERPVERADPEEPANAMHIDTWQLATLWAVVACGEVPAASDSLEERWAAIEKGRIISSAVRTRADAELAGGSDRLAAFLSPPGSRQLLSRLVVEMRAAAGVPRRGARPAWRRWAEPGRWWSAGRHWIWNRPARAVVLAAQQVPQRPWMWLSWLVAGGVLTCLAAWRWMSSAALVLSQWTDLERWAVTGAVGLLAASVVFLSARSVVLRSRTPAAGSRVEPVLLVVAAAAVPVVAQAALVRITDSVDPLTHVLVLCLGAALGALVATVVQRRSRLWAPALGLASVLGGAWWMWQETGGLPAAWRWWFAPGILAVVVLVVGRRVDQRGWVSLVASTVAVTVLLWGAGTLAGPSSWSRAWSPVAVSRPAPQFLLPADLGSVDEDLGEVLGEVGPALRGSDSSVEGGPDYDSRAFVQVREPGGDWTRAVDDVVAGDEVELRVWVLSGETAVDIQDLVLRIEVSHTRDREAALRPRLSWRGSPAPPGQLTDAVQLVGGEPLAWSMVPGTAVVGAGDDARSLDVDELGAAGTRLEVDGQLAAGTYVDVHLRARPADSVASALVTVSGEDPDYGRAVDLSGAAQSVTVAMYAGNTEERQQQEVEVRLAALPEQLVYVPGSTRIYRTRDGEPEIRNEGVAGAGLSIGPLPPGDGRWVLATLVLDPGACAAGPVQVVAEVTAAGQVLRSTVDVVVPFCA